MVDAGQHLAPLGERPAVEVAPGLEQPQHAVEAAGQRLGARPDLAAHVVQLAPARRSGLAARPAGGGRGRGSRAPGGSATAAPRSSAALGAVGRRRPHRRRRRRPPAGPGAARRPPGAGRPGCWAAYGRGQLDRARARSGGSSKSSAPSVSRLAVGVDAPQPARRRPCGRRPTARPAAGRPRSTTSPGHAAGPGRTRRAPGAGGRRRRSPLGLHAAARYSLDVAPLAARPRASSRARRSCWRSMPGLEAAPPPGRPGTGRSDRLSRWWASAGS